MITKIFYLSASFFIDVICLFLYLFIMSREDRNYNPKYLKQEKVNLSSSPKKFLGRWLTKSKYESRKGLKDKIAENVTSDFLESLWNKQKGKCGHSKDEMTYIRGKGVVETNVAVGRKNVTKPYTRDNIVLVQHKYYRDYN